jgi:hypothetical protein
MGPVGMVIGTVFDSAGNLASNVNVSITTSASQGGFSENIPTDSGGMYYSFGIGLGNITVTATFADKTTATVTGVLAADGQTLTLDIGKASTARIFGTIFDANGDPAFYPAVTLTAAPPSTAVVHATGDYSGVYAATSRSRPRAAAAPRTVPRPPPSKTRPMRSRSTWALRIRAR